MSRTRVIECAGAIVFDEQGRLLMVRRGNLPSRGLWSEPSGRCLPGEPAADAAVRECEEETGLVVRAPDRVGGVSVAGAEGTSYFIEDFRCELVGGELRAGDDATEARWISAAELTQLPLAPGVLDALTDWRCLPR